MDLLQQIIEVLKASSIAEERGKGANSKFWAAYKKISGEYDDKMVQNYNGSIDTIMLFAGLFSAVNTAFVIAMQPNPADTTNDLLVQLMQNAPWNAQRQVALSASVAYSSSKIWMQVLAYTSLTFSLLAALGAVLCKEWLGYYKTNDDRARLADEYQQRHRKFEELQKMHFEYILHSLPVLLQISLFLFILSMATAMWMQHRIVSFFIIVPTACGALFYCYIVLESLNSPDSSFRTPIYIVIRYLLHFLPKGHENNEDKTASAMSWILKISTNPDVFKLALDLMVTMSYQPLNIQLSLLIQKVLDMFKECFNSSPVDKSNAVSFGRALIYISWKIDGAMKILGRPTPVWKHWSSWRSLYFPQALEHCRTSFHRMKETVSTDPREQANDTPTALRMALGAGMDKFVNPDKEDEYVELVWHGKFGSELNFQDVEVDWLMECARHFHEAEDFNAAGDALLLLSDLKNISQDSIVPFLNNRSGSPRLRHCALRAACRAVNINSPCDPSFIEAVLTTVNIPPIRRGHNDDSFANVIDLLKLPDWPQLHPLLGSPLIDIQRLVFVVLSESSLNNTANFDQYYSALIDFMHRANGPDSKRAAVYVAYHIRRALATITETPSSSIPVSSQTADLSTLSRALLRMVSSESESEFYDHVFYFRLIFTLTSRPNWLHRLREDGHIKRCLEIMSDVSKSKYHTSFFYLAGIFLRIEVTSGEQSFASRKWWDLMKVVWDIAGCNAGDDSNVLDHSDSIEILDVLVTTTKVHMPDASESDLEVLRNGLDGAILKLELRQYPVSKEIKIIDEMEYLKRRSRRPRLSTL